MDKLSPKILAEDLLKQYGEFICIHDQSTKSHCAKLLNCNSNNRSNSNNIVDINYETTEELVLPNFQSYDRQLSKILLTFSQLQIEMQNLLKKAKILQQKFVLIDKSLAQKINKTTNKALLSCMSRNIEYFIKINFFIQYTVCVVKHVINQCDAFLNEVAAEINLHHILDNISKILMEILIFNELFANSYFRRNWPLYISKIKEYNMQNTGEYNGLYDSIRDIDTLFSNDIFCIFLDNLKRLQNDKSTYTFKLYANEYIQLKLSKMDATQLAEQRNQIELVHLNLFAVLFHEKLGQLDTKILRNLYELNGKRQHIWIYYNILWMPARFILKYGKSFVRGNEKLLMQQAQQNYKVNAQNWEQIQLNAKTYCKKITLIALKLCQMYNNNNMYDMKIEYFKELSNLLLAGKKIADQLHCLLIELNGQLILYAKYIEDTTISCALCNQIIDLINLIKLIFETKVTTLAKIINSLLQYLQFKLLQQLTLANKKILILKKHKNKIDMLTALKFAEKCLKGPPTTERLMIAYLALPTEKVLLKERIISPHQLQTLQTIWKYAKNILNLQKTFNNDLYEFKQQQQKNNQILKFQTINIDTATEENNLSTEIELYLRLEGLADVLINQNRPFEQSLCDRRSIVHANSIPMNGIYIVPRSRVENYLSAIFYNLTTCATHDWNTYESIRYLALKHMQLTAIDSSLPNQIVDQGTDILLIMRNIYTFTSKYVYNMNMHIFVLKQRENKILDTVGIRHVANSMRTHGTGVLNTAINFFYQFLRQKFYLFSTFLYDEQVQSRLLKDQRILVERKKHKNYVFLYTYEQAETFIKDIRKLGVSNSGETFMDLFRRVITHVGNAMGYIRLMQSGCRNVTYNSSIYLPDLITKDMPMYENNFQEATKISLQNFHKNITDLMQNFTQSTNIFMLLVETFKPFFRNQYNNHLKSFYLIIPPLMVNYVEHMTAAKSKIQKKDLKDAILFDDGFALGLSYILQLMEQKNEFNELQWLQNVRYRMDKERQKILTMLKDYTCNVQGTHTNLLNNTMSQENEKLLQTLSLFKRRINALEIENTLFCLNLSSADVFFT